MENKLVWSNHATMDYASGLDDEEKLNYLVDERDYDPEMLGSNNLDDVIFGDKYMSGEDAEDFELNVRPMIENQCRDGKVVLLGEVGRWNGSHGACYVIDPEDILTLSKDVDDIEIEDDGEGLVYLGHHHDGTITMKMYHFSDDDEAFRNEIIGLDCVKEYRKWYDVESDEEALDILANESVGGLFEYMNFSKIPEVLPRVVNKLNINEDAINEVRANKDEAKGLKKELKQIEPLVDEYGYEYFTSMPFTAYDNDPTSVEYQFPNFFKVCKAFFKEMGLIEKEDINDDDILDDQWYTDIDQHDFDTILKVCHIISEKPGKNKMVDRVYKDGISDGIDDKKVLADREKEDELAAEYGDKDESLIENLNDGDTIYMTISWGGIEGRDLEKRYFTSEEAAIEDAKKDTWNSGFTLFKGVAKLINGKIDVEFEDEGRDIESGFGKDNKDESLTEAKKDLDGKQKLVTADLDWADGDLPNKYTKKDVIDSIKKAGCPKSIKIKVVELSGPGGGWPDVELRGPKKDLVKFLSKCGFDEDGDGYELFDESLTEDKKPWDKYIGKRVRIHNLDEFTPADFGFDMEDPGDKEAYDELLAHNNAEGVITDCAEQYDGFEGYWDVKCDDGYELPALSDYHLEVLDNIDESKLNEWEDNGYRQHVWIIIGEDAPEEAYDEIVDACGEPEGEGDWDDGGYVLDYYFDDLDSAMDFANNIPDIDGVEWDNEETDEMAESLTEDHGKFIVNYRDANYDSYKHKEFDTKEKADDFATHMYGVGYNDIKITNEPLTEASEAGAWYGPRTDYTVTIQKVAPGTHVHNKLENADYTTDENKCYVITGTVGEQWPVDAKKVQQKYICDLKALESGKPVKAKINPEAVKNDKGYFVVCKEPREVKTDWGDVLHAEPGDLLRSSGPGEEPDRVVDPGVFKTTYQKLNENAINEDNETKNEIYNYLESLGLKVEYSRAYDTFGFFKRTADASISISDRANDGYHDFPVVQIWKSDGGYVYTKEVHSVEELKAALAELDSKGIVNLKESIINKDMRRSKANESLTEDPDFDFAPGYGNGKGGWDTGWTNLDSMPDDAAYDNDFYIDEPDEEDLDEGRELDPNSLEDYPWGNPFKN